LKRTGEQFSLRGIEIAAEGLLARTGDQWLLLLPGEKPLTLTRLTEKVQWDAMKKQRAAVAESEAGAFGRLDDEAASHRERLLVIGPLRREESGDLTLEVRDFAWIRAQQTQKPSKVANGRK
jgi:hypothetical protein